MLRRLILSSSLLVATPALVLAQPATDAPTKANNPANQRQPFLNPQEQQKVLDDTKKFMQQTPEQQKATMRGMTQFILRSSLKTYGFKEKELQDAVVQFVDEQETFRQDVRAAGTKLYLALNAQNAPLDAKAMEALLTDYLEAAAEVRSERTVAAKALDQKIGFSKLPHQHAFLELNGIIGEAASLTGDVTMMGTLALGTLSMTTNQAATPVPQDPKAKPFKAQEFIAMTPVQRRAYMRDLNQQTMRAFLTSASFKDQKLQDEILLFVDEQEKSREEVRRAGGKVSAALMHIGAPTDAQTMESLLNDYLLAVDDAKATRETATKAFEAKIGLATNPRLRAFLLLHGIIGDASSLTGDIVLTGSMASTSVIRTGD